MFFVSLISYRFLRIQFLSVPTLGSMIKSAQSFFTVIETILVSANVLLFMFTMILLFTGERAENQRIRKLNE